MEKCVIICNPNSGHNNKRELIDKFQTILKQKNYEVEVIYTKYGGHAKKIVKDLPDETDLVISLGGDGTFNEVVTGNTKRDCYYLIFHLEQPMI